MLASPLGGAVCAPTFRVHFNARNPFPTTKSAWFLEEISVFDDICSGFSVGFAGAFFEIEFLAIFERLGDVNSVSMYSSKLRMTARLTASMLIK